MDEISNKTLAIMVVCAIVVSLGGTLLSLNKLSQVPIGVTGLVTTNTSQGIAQVEVQSITEITFVNDTVNFGPGYVYDTCNYCEMASNGTRNNTCCVNLDGVSGWNDTTNYLHGLVLRNDGNYNVSLEINCSDNASTLLGGTTPAYERFMYRFVSGNETNHPTVDGTAEDDTEYSCYGGWPTGWQNFTKTMTTVCGAGYDYYYHGHRDDVEMEILVRVPADSSRGSLQANITAIATSEA